MDVSIGRFYLLKKICLTTYATVLLCLFMSPAAVFALGIGNISLNSALNQPLDAEIPIKNIKPKDIDGLTVSLARDDIYERMGIDLTPELKHLSFKILEDTKGEYRVHISSKDSIREPFLSFLLEFNWPNGRTLKEFTVLLDPPVFVDEKTAPVDTPKSTPPARFVINQPLENSVPVTEPTPIERSLPVSNDDLFADAEQEDIQYGPVKNNDTLWTIADGMKPTGISVEQMMLGLFRDNPQAFFGNNVSMLNAGAILRIKDPQALSGISKAEAIAEMKRHHREWLEMSRQRKASNAVTSESADVAPRGSDSFEALDETAEPLLPENDASELLELVSPVSEDFIPVGNDNAGVNVSSEEIKAVRTELALTNEAAEAARRENEELNTRLSALEKQVAAMQRLIQLKDQELQMLQGVTSEVDVVADTSTVEFDLGVSGSDEQSLDEDVAATEMLSESNVTTEPVEQEVVPPSTVDNIKAKIQALLQDPVNLATAAGVLLLLIVLVWMLIRKRIDKDEDAELASMREEDTWFTPDADDTSQNEPVEGNSHPSNEEEQIEVHDFSAISDLGFGPTEGGQMAGGSSDIDPLAEADVYIAYGRFKKAEDLLKTAIKIEPERHQLKLKLLEISYAQRDVETFNERADQLYQALGGAEHPIWERVVDMGVELCPDNPSFNGQQADYQLLAESPSVDFTEQVSGTQSKDYEVTPPQAIDGEDIDIDIDEQPSSYELYTEIADGSLGLTPRFVSEKQEAAASISDSPGDVDKSTASEEWQDNDLPPLEFSVPDFSTKLPEANPVVDKSLDDVDIKADLFIEEISAEDKPSALDMSYFSKTEILDDEHQAHESSTMLEAHDFSLLAPLDDDEPKSELTDTVIGQVPEDAQESVSENKQGSFFLLNDEVSTKMELARAYVDMGDVEAANELLYEVVQSGNEEQKREAESLMLQLRKRSHG